VRTGSNCNSVAVNATTNKVYVSNNFGHSVTVIDGVTNEATTFRVGQGPRAIAVNPVTNKIYTANYGSRDSSEIDGATNAVTSVPTGKHPWAIAVEAPTDTWSMRTAPFHPRRRGRDKDRWRRVRSRWRCSANGLCLHSGSTMTVIDGATTLTRTVRSPHPSASPGDQ
jgi:YVTN family beta-propeller protein